MAEVAAALYAAETVVEGVAVGALAVSRSTAPLHLNFRKITLPTREEGLARSGHTLNIVKGKAYIIGGRQDDSTVLALTLPVASSTDGEGDLTPRDFESVHPEYRNENRPLAPHDGSEETSSSRFTFNRTGHTTTAIGDKLYVWGGKGTTSDQPPEDVPAQSSDHFVVFDVLTNTYSILTADTSKCREGLPPSRANHTATSTPHPQPGSLPDGPTIDAHGTIFIHGGSSDSPGGPSPATDLLSAGLVPMTTGAGRQYLVYFMGREIKIGGLNDFWSFQIQSEEVSAASIKDKVRDMVSKAKPSWESGKHTWAKCELAKEDSKTEKQEHRDDGAIGKESSGGWPEGLHDFGCDVWNDQGGHVFVIWGGRRDEEVVDEGWVASVQ
ncbi:hypothetical protein LTR40_006202 [Exophiala xenobiotica]|nr:hypothetical protein LTR40_006202 [Exophiala xenobiotica]